MKIYKKEKPFLIAIYLVFVVVFLLKGVSNPEVWVASILLYTLSVYWVFSFVFRKNMYIFAIAYPLEPDNDEHVSIRKVIFFAALSLMIIVLIFTK